MNLSFKAPHLLAQVFGTVNNPLPAAYGNVNTPNGGIVLFLSNILRFVFIVAGIYALLNFIIAGFTWMGAAGDTKATTAAWNRIWQTLLGLVIIVGAFAIAALVGQIIFGDASFILKPTIYGP